MQQRRWCNVLEMGGILKNKLSPLRVKKHLIFFLCSHLNDAIWLCEGKMVCTGNLGVLSSLWVWLFHCELYISHASSKLNDIHSD